MKPKKRLQISLSASSYEVIERYAKLQGRPKSAVVTELLEAVVPALGRSLALMEAAANAPEKIKKDLSGTIESMEAEMLERAGGIDTRLNWLQDKIEGKK